jgi:hypothetical protein
MTINGFEIRLELLKMAKEMLEQDWHAQRELVMTDYHTRVDKGEGLVPPMPAFKPFPTETEIIAKAKTLNEFVVHKGA